MAVPGCLHLGLRQPREEDREGRRGGGEGRGRPAEQEGRGTFPVWKQTTETTSAAGRNCPPGEEI